MVMHARKIQRLNDGYYDRGQSHPYEEKNSSKYRHYNDRFGESKRDSPKYRYSGTGGDGRSARDRDESPSGRSSPRYQNKASHMDRSKDHGEKGNAIDRRANSDRAKGGKDGRNREQKERDHRAQVRKAAMRVCGDWSEHVSSKGKCYYYNCKTEESKWEKPKDWNDSLASSLRDSKERKVAHPSKKSYDDRQKHSSNAGASSSHDRPRSEIQHTNRSSTSFGSPALSRHASHDSGSAHHGSSGGSSRYSEDKRHASRQSLQQQSHSSTNSSNNGGHCKSGAYPSHRPHYSHSNTWQGPDKSRQSDSKPPNLDRTFSTPERPGKGYERHNRLNSGGGGNTPVGWHAHGHRSSTSHAGSNEYNGARHLRNDNEDSQQAEDMDISPSSTPTEESMVERHVPKASTPVSMVTGTPPSVSSSQRASSSAILGMLSNLTTISGIAANDLPALANLSSLTNLVTTSPGGNASSPGSLLPQLLQQLASGGRSTPPSQSHAQSCLGSQQVLQQAIQVLQKLQENLVAQQKQQQQRQLQQLLVTQLQQLQHQLQQQQQQQQPHHKHQSSQPGATHHSAHHSTHKASLDDGSQSPYSPPDESDGTPLQSPEYNHNNSNPPGGHQHHHHQDEPTTTRVGGRESPRSEHSLKSSRRESPTPSHSSSQNVSSVGTSQLSAAHRKHDSVHLTPSLANYYDDKLIGHVSGLIYDQTERQSDIVAEEVHTIGSVLCTQVSADLKGARSLVRAGEIISTLHEQRILFIRQQIKDLDGWRTHNTFMPSSSSSQPPPGGAT